MKNLFRIMLVMWILCLISGCGRGNTESGGKTPEKITVFAASSLSEVFTDIAKDFEKREGGSVKVEFNFAGSQTLKTSLENGVKADIFASAGIDYMDELKKEGLIGEYKLFIKNKLGLLRNKNSKFYVGELKDLSVKGIKIATGDVSVPVGKYWLKALDEALKDGTLTEEEKGQIEGNIKTRELNVKDVVSKVLLNQVDFGVVYATDFLDDSSSELELIELPVFEKIPAYYPIAILKGSEEKTAVNKFCEYVFSREGKELFEKYKFDPHF